MSNSLFSVEEQAEQNNVKIKVIGVGGGGGNMINHMVKEGVTGVDLISANTDSQALNSNLASVKVQLGEKETRGLGAGMRPDIGRKAAEESYSTIKATLEGSDLVFIAVGLGGGTGTGASSVVAHAAKECGALTIGVCTQPFTFEGSKRSKLAKEGLKEFKKECDSIVVIKNDKLLSIAGKNMSYNESFALVDSVLSRAVNGISRIVLPNSSSTEGINVDFADLKTVMSYKGLALMGMGQAQGEDAAFEALKSAIESPLIEDLTISGSKGIVVNFQINPAYPVIGINQAMSGLVDAAVDPDADIIFGTSIDPSFEEDFVKVTIVATGFEKEPMNVEQPKEERMMFEIPSSLRAVGDIKIDESLVNLDIPTYIRNKRD
ncbi:MAG: cell division protein FtsZ [Helicobacteraceae bacterium]